VFGAGKHFDEIFGGEERAQHQEARQVQFAFGDGRQQRGKATHMASRSDAPERFVFGETQFVHAVGVQARTGTSAVKATRFDLSQVREETRQELVRAADEASRGREELRVGELAWQTWNRLNRFSIGRASGGEQGHGEVGARLHLNNLHPGFLCLRIRALASERRHG
jgi:hypothetical protein